MNPMISLIVPVYNVEDYLDRCVQSIINQTYDNLEIILVDDGSTDTSSEICDNWKERDNRIVVIHKKNGGLSDARNTGLKTAKGEYIGFIDSDDFINKDMYRVLINTILQSKADIAECRWIPFEDKTDLLDKRKTEYGDIVVFSAEEALKELILERKLKQTVVNKIYSRHIINTFFPIEKINEDEYWTYHVFGSSKRIAFVDTVLYYYYQRNTSIMHVDYSIKRLDGVFARKERMCYIKNNYPRLFSYACLSFLWACFYHYQVICRNPKIDKDGHYRKILFKDFCDNYDKRIVRKKGFKQSLWMICFKNMPNYTCKVRNMLKIGL